MQRTIVRGVMDAGELGGFAVDKVEVDLAALPRVKFQLSPADAPLGVEASRILRAIDRLNQRVQALSRPRTGWPADPRPPRQHAAAAAAGDGHPALIPLHDRATTAQTAKRQKPDDCDGYRAPAALCRTGDAAAPGPPLPRS